MTPTPSLISIVLVFHNASVTNLAAAIESVLAQNYSQWELLLVDDGSTNKSSNLARNYALLFPQHIYYLEHDHHRCLGVSASYNRGLEQATGQYISFLTANQIWLPHKLQHQLSLLVKHPESDAVFGFLENSSVDIQLSNWEQRQYWNQKLNLALGNVSQPPDLSILLLLNHLKPFSLGDILLHRQTIELTGKFDLKFNLTYAPQMFLLQVCLHAAVLIDHQSSMNYAPSFSGSQAENFHPETDTYPDSERLARRVYLFWLEKYLISDSMLNQAISRLIHQQLFPNRYPWHNRVLAHLQRSFHFFRIKN
ncbi:MAG: glycosyltransferase family A protein [Cyanobacteria bacterium J06648_1]